MDTDQATGLAELRRLLYGNRATHLIHAAAELGLADLLAAGPQSSGELPTPGEITVKGLAAVGGTARGAATSAGRVAASPPECARGMVIRYTPRQQQEWTTLCG
ncbi:MAG: hypothetical protein M3R06_05520 [Chloroflexota bacterium]|nr:hypothetical protein [Chloroflexota bacterium]